jgi:hypothetical protein
MSCSVIVQIYRVDFDLICLVYRRSSGFTEQYMYMTDSYFVVGYKCKAVLGFAPETYIGTMLFCTGRVARMYGVGR